MTVLGLTGPTGSGKGMLAEAFRKQGIPVLDTDAVYHELTSKPSPCVSRLQEAFGEGILFPDGSLNRHALGAVVFSRGAEDKLRLLDEITHKFVLDEVRRRISRLDADTPAVLVDAPLLFESGFDAECDIILCVIAKKDVRIERIVRRDGITEEMASARIASQKSDAFLIENSDFVIRNDGDLYALGEEVARVAEEILKK